VRPLDEELALAERCVERWDGHEGLVHTGLVVETGANWMLHNATSEEAIHRTLELARRLARETIEKAGIQHRLDSLWNPVPDLRR
jgi:hypothetical protein